MQDKERTGKQRKRQKRKTKKEFQGERDLGYKRGILCVLQWGGDTREVPEDWLRSSFLYQPLYPCPVNQSGRMEGVTAFPCLWCRILEVLPWTHSFSAAISELFKESVPDLFGL